jgi:hypothetical protein
MEIKKQISGENTKRDDFLKKLKAKKSKEENKNKDDIFKVIDKNY